MFQALKAPNHDGHLTSSHINFSTCAGTIPEHRWQKLYNRVPTSAVERPEFQKAVATELLGIALAQKLGSAALIEPLL